MLWPMAVLQEVQLPRALCRAVAHGGTADQRSAAPSTILAAARHVCAAEMGAGPGIQRLLALQRPAALLLAAGRAAGLLCRGFKPQRMVFASLQVAGWQTHPATLICCLPAPGAPARGHGGPYALRSRSLQKEMRTPPCSAAAATAVQLLLLCRVLLLLQQGFSIFKLPEQMHVQQQANHSGRRAAALEVCGCETARQAGGRVCK